MRDIIWQFDKKRYKRLAERYCRGPGFGDEPDDTSPDWYRAHQKMNDEKYDVADAIVNRIEGHFNVITIDYRGWFKVYRSMRELFQTQ